MEDTHTNVGTSANHVQEKHYKEWPNAAAFNALGDTRNEVKLIIIGSFPDYASGTLYRIGPGGYKITRPAHPDFTCSHWFDGFTTTHKFNIGKLVTYSSYCQVDALIENARKTGKLDGITFGQKCDLCDTFYCKVKTMFDPVLPAGPTTLNIGVTIRHALPSEARGVSGRMIANTNNNSTKLLDSATLEPLAVIT